MVRWFADCASEDN